MGEARPRYGAFRKKTYERDARALELAIKGLSHAQIGERLGVAGQRVGMMIYRARKRAEDQARHGEKRS
jgi:DNA-directed RNA polymerase specialized sigma24 family protein